MARLGNGVSVYERGTLARVVGLSHKHTVLDLGTHALSYGTSREASLRIGKPARETRVLLYLSPLLPPPFLIKKKNQFI